MSAFDEAMLLPFLDDYPGNAAAYVKIREDFPRTHDWTNEDWTNIRMVYYCVMKDPISAWLHDIYKNKCLYDTSETVKVLDILYKLY